MKFIAPRTPNKRSSYLKNVDLPTISLLDVLASTLSLNQTLHHCHYAHLQYTNGQIMINNLKSWENMISMFQVLKYILHFEGTVH